MSSRKKEKIFFILIFAIGVLVRVYGFGLFPGGLNQDEAFAGYEAFSLLKNGTDSWGYTNPVYFVSWGSGMNVLSSYLMIPFIALFGNTAIAVRMPQLIASLFALWVFFLVLKECVNVRCALLGMLVLAISPWHTMISKWALESNMAPHMWIIGFYFFMRALKDNRFLPLSMIFYGLSLYAYATMWIFVPATLFPMFCYAFYKKSITSIKTFILSGFILGIIALPLIMFVMVNKDIIPEIKTDLISIPKLLYMRNSEISIKNAFSLETYKNLFNVIIRQDDGQVYNSIKYGSYYHLSIPFLFVGVWSSFKTNNSFCRMLHINIFIGLMIALSMSGTNMNRINFVHFPLLFFIAIGLETVAKKSLKSIRFGIIPLYMIFFCLFAVHYFTGYQTEIAQHFDSGLEKAVAALPDGDVTVDRWILHPKILFYAKEDTKDYMETVRFSNYPSAYLAAESFGRYKFTNDYENIDADTVLLKKANTVYLDMTEYEAEYYGETVILKKRKK